MACQPGFMTEKNSSRVLRPPGGGSSDIFGSYATPTATPPRKDRMKSSIFGGDGGDDQNTPRRASARGGDGSPGGQQTHVFGESEPTKQPPAARENTQTNIFGGTPQPKCTAPAENGDSKKEEEEEDEDKKDGETEKKSDDTTTPQVAPVAAKQRASFNPITGSEDEPQKPTTKPSSEPHTSTRIRQPPGGASSGLW